MRETVFITGADRGLGLELVRHFCTAGWRVYAGTYANGPDLLKKLAGQSGGHVIVVPQDVSSVESVQASARDVAQRESQLDLLINVAGVVPGNALAPITDLNLEAGHDAHVMEVNAFGPLRVVQAFLPLLERGSRKLIVNVSSEAGSISKSQRVNHYRYCMSRAALNMGCKILQNWLKPKGIKVLAIEPGWMKTEMGGPNATLDPAVPAAGIFALAERKWSVDDPIYMDYEGNLLNW
jgi:NAD(P)-dependent dehydrogenase (short-subunit alcohol dehydrogenase family)